jgi:hypothetical protein
MSADLTSRLEALLEDIARLTFVETNTVLFQRVHAPAVRDAIETLRQLSAPSAIRLNDGNSYVIDGVPHKVCDCPKLDGKCARGLPRTLLTTEFSRCMVPV